LRVPSEQGRKLADRRNRYRFQRRDSWKKAKKLPLWSKKGKKSPEGIRIGILSRKMAAGAGRVGAGPGKDEHGEQGVRVPAAGERRRRMKISWGKGSRGGRNGRSVSGIENFFDLGKEGEGDGKRRIFGRGGASGCTPRVVSPAVLTLKLLP
jgi:hypothetical protein